MKQLIKILGFIFIFLITLIIIFFVVNTLSNNEETKDSNEKINLFRAEDGLEKDEELFVFSGEFVCLPSKDESKPLNDLCAFGIKNNNDYYRLQSISDDKFNVIAKLNLGQKIEVSGKLINEESKVYKTLGTIEVDTVKVLDVKDSEAN